jgi:nucleotide-binding universal stress UspA family protein
MKHRILLAIDLREPSARAVSYAVHLAARLRLALVLMAVAPDMGENPGGWNISLAKLPKKYRMWLQNVVEHSQRENLSLEIFLAAGLFYDEVLRFVRSQPAIRFIVMGLPEDWPQDGQPHSSSALRSLAGVFEGEVLLVRRQGGVMRLADHLHPGPSGKEI